MDEDNWTWESFPCDYEGCSAPVTHWRYIDDELRGRFCEEHMQQLASEHAWFWHDVIGTATAAAGADYDPLELGHSPAAIAELHAPVRHPDRGEGDGRSLAEQIVAEGSPSPTLAGVQREALAPIVTGIAGPGAPLDPCLPHDWRQDVTPGGLEAEADYYDQAQRDQWE